MGSELNDAKKSTKTELTLGVLTFIPEKEKGKENKVPKESMKTYGLSIDPKSIRNYIKNNPNEVLDLKLENTIVKEDKAENSK